MNSYKTFEEYFQDCAKNNNKEYLFKSYEHIKKQVRSITEVGGTFWSTYKLRDHSERIIDVIYQAIAPFLEKKLALSVAEQYILLSSAYLHDLVKFFPALSIDISGIQSLTSDQIKTIEKTHDYDIFRILMFCIFEHHRNVLRTNHFNLKGMIEEHNFFKDLRKEDKRILIESIAIICGLHKSLTLKAEQEMQNRMNKFLICDTNRIGEDKRGETEDWKSFGNIEDIRKRVEKKGIKIDLLAGLLKLGDCFDISEERINKKMIKDVELGLSTVEDAKVLAKWYQFNIVKNVKVKPKDHNIDIIVEYCIPPNLGKDELHKLTFFRMLAEKDFEDLTYLKVIEYYLSELSTEPLLDPHSFEDFLTKKYGDGAIEMKDGITVTAKYRVRREKKENGDIIGDVIQYIDSTLTDYKNKNPKVIEPIKSYKTFPGYEKSPEKVFPTSKEVLFVLSFFDRYSSEQFSIEEIKNKTGLNPTQINIICRNLADLKYLEMDPRDSSKFRKVEEGEPGKKLKQIMEEYQRNPLNLKIKAWEIEKFGKFIPLENITKGEIIPTEIPGFDEILSDEGDASKGGIKADQCILIKGAPGTGKTTFAIQLLLNKKDLNCLYLTFEEDLKQLRENFKDFEFDFSNIKFVTLAGLLSRKPPADDLSEQIFDFLTNEIDKENPDILVVDSITRFREFADDKNVRTVLSDFMSILKIRHITSFFIGEEVKNGYNFEDYLVDGIIKLEYQKGKRSLEVMKMRGQDFVSGAHSYEIFDKNGIQSKSKDFNIKPGINVYPNLNTYLRKKEGKNYNRTLIHSGTNGLDELLPIDDEKGGFIEGEFILIAGSPGSGKTLIGLQFLNEEINHKERGLWISFEGELNELEKSIGNIEKLQKMIENEDFKFEYFAPFNINLDEFVYIINRYLKCGVKRIVIDSISDLIAVFKDKLEFKNFVNSFLQILHKYGATTMLLYRVPNFFGSPEALGIEVTSIVDTILLLKNVEIHNKLDKGIFVLKMRGRKHRSEIQSVVVSKNGLEVKKLGWSMEGLLSGTIGEIQEPEVFIKIFYENEAEDSINEGGAQEFANRYPTGRVKVAWVRKPEFHIDFWSFREERGPSHSNVKIVSLKKYWASGFIEKEQLYPLGNYIPQDLKDERKGERFWEECLEASKKVGKNDKSSDIYLIPYYADINVLTYRKDIFKEAFKIDKLTWDSILNKAKENYKIEHTSNDTITWDNLFNLADNVIKELPEEIRPSYCFAMPYLVDKSSFMTFFLEVLWASGGNIFKFPDALKLDSEEIKKDDATPDELRRYVLANLEEVLVINNSDAIKALKTLRSWVFVKNYSPNPYEGNFIQDALFSVQWYSKIKNRNEIGIAAPPVIESNSDKSYITYDLCCLALIKGAIAPEMGWLCIDSLSSTKNMKQMAEKKIGLPSREEAYYNQEYVNFDKEANDIVKKFIFEERKKSKNYELKTLSRIPYYYKIESLIHNEIKNVFHPTKSEVADADVEIKKALDNAYEKIKEFLKEQK